MSLAFANLMIWPTQLPPEFAKMIEDIDEEIVQEERLGVTRRRFIQVKRLARSGGSLAPVGMVPEFVVEDLMNQNEAEEASLIMPPTVK